MTGHNVFSYPRLAKHPDVVALLSLANSTVSQYADISDFSEWKHWDSTEKLYQDGLLSSLFNQFFERGTGDRSPNFYAADSIVKEEALYAGMLRYMLDTKLLPDVMERHELEQYRKAGPYLKANAEFLLSNTCSYWSNPIDKVPNHPKFDWMLDLARRVAADLVEANGGHLVPLGADETFDRMVKTTYFGAPFFTSKWFQAGQTTPESQALYLWLSDVLDSGDYTNVREALRQPFVTFSRVVPNGRLRGDMSDNKARRTFAATKFEGGLAKAFSYPLLQLIRSNVVWSFYGGNHVGSPFMKYALRKSGSCLSLDWSGFDQTALTGARRVVKEVFLGLFEPSFHFLVEEIFSSLDYAEYFTPYGYVHSIRNPQGLPSGAGFTGLIGSFWNYIVTSSLLDDLGQQPEALFTYGDDTVVTFKDEKLPVCLKEVARAADTYGMRINVDKQDYGEGENRFSVYLQKRYCWDGRKASDPMHPIMRQLPRLLHRDVTNEPLDEAVFGKAAEQDPVRRLTLDTLSNLEEVCYHPYFETLVHLVVLGHPTLLDPRLVIDYNAVRMRDINGEAAPTRGIETLKVVNVIQTLYNKALAQGWEYDRHRPSSLEIDYHAQLLFQHEVSRCKGYTYTVDQRLQYFRGEDINLTSDQRRTAQAYGMCHGTSLFDKVVAFQIQKGVLLTRQQVIALDQGKKVMLTKAQQDTASTYGRLSDTDKQGLAEDMELNQTKFAAQVREHVTFERPTLERSREAALLAFGRPDDTVLQKLYTVVQASSRILDYVACMEEAIKRDKVSVGRNGLPLDWVKTVILRF